MHVACCLRLCWKNGCCYACDIVGLQFESQEHIADIRSRASRLLFRISAKGVGVISLNLKFKEVAIFAPYGHVCFGWRS